MFGDLTGPFCFTTDSKFYKTAFTQTKNFFAMNFGPSELKCVITSDNTFFFESRIYNEKPRIKNLSLSDSRT